MIQWNDLKPGMEVMWGYLGFSYKNFKITKIEYPKKFRVRQVTKDMVTLENRSIDGSTYCCSNNFYKSSYGTVLNNTLYYASDVDEMISDWNSLVYNQLDSLKSDYETKEERLRKKLVVDKFPTKK